MWPYLRVTVVAALQPSIEATTGSETPPGARHAGTIRSAWMDHRARRGAVWGVPRRGRSVAWVSDECRGLRPLEHEATSFNTCFPAVTRIRWGYTCGSVLQRSLVNTHV